MSSTPPHAGTPRDDSPLQRPGAEPGPQRVPVPGSTADEGMPTPTGYVLQGSVAPEPDESADGDEAAPEPNRRWQPGALFAAVLAGAVLLGAGWLVYSRWIAPAPEPAPPSPTLILQPPPSGLGEDLEPPHGDAGFETAAPGWPEVTPVVPDLSRTVALAGEDPIVARVSQSTAMVLVGGRLSYLNLSEGTVNWDAPAEGRFASSPGSGAVVQVAPDGEAVSRVALTGDELSRGTITGRPALCGDLLLDIDESSVDAYQAGELGEKLWSLPLDAGAAATLDAPHLDCWQRGRWWYVGDRPQYGLRVAPATPEVRPVRGWETETVRVEADGELTAIIGPAGQSLYPGEVVAVAEAGQVVATVHHPADGAPVLRGSSTQDGTEFWSVAAGGITHLFSVGGHLFGWDGETLRSIDPATGESNIDLNADTGESAWGTGDHVAADAHGNLCSYSSSDPVGLGEIRVACATGDRAEDWAFRLPGGRLRNIDGIWVVEHGSEVEVFQ